MMNANHSTKHHHRCEGGEMFTTAVDQQRDMLIHVLQGERERARDNWSLGKFTIDFEPAPRGVRAWVCNSNRCQRNSPRSCARHWHGPAENRGNESPWMSMTPPSSRWWRSRVEHAFDDLAARRWIEGKLKADQLAVSDAQGTCGLRRRTGRKRQRTIEVNCVR